MFFQAQDDLLVVQGRQEDHAAITVESHLVILVEEFIKETFAGVFGQLLAAGLEQEDLHECVGHEHEDELVDNQGELSACPQ